MQPLKTFNLYESNNRIKFNNKCYISIVLSSNVIPYCIVIVLSEQRKKDPALQPDLENLYKKMSLYSGGERGIRTLGTRKGTPVFKTGALNQLDHLSMSIATICIISTLKKPVNAFQEEKY